MPKIAEKLMAKNNKPNPKIKVLLEEKDSTSLLFWPISKPKIDNWAIIKNQYCPCKTFIRSPDKSR